MRRFSKACRRPNNRGAACRIKADSNLLGCEPRQHLAKVRERDLSRHGTGPLPEDRAGQARMITGARQMQRIAQGGLTLSPPRKSRTNLGSRQGQPFAP